MGRQVGRGTKAPWSRLACRGVLDWSDCVTLRAVAVTPDSQFLRDWWTRVNHYRVLKIKGSPNWFPLYPEHPKLTSTLV